jgi:PAS domain S-box-containing protein
LIDQRLRESELRLKIALKAAQIGIWDWDIPTDTMEYSARARAICGFPPGVPITFAMARAVTHPQDLPHTSAQAQRAIDPVIRDRNPYEYRVVRADTGEVRWVVAHGEAIFTKVDGATKAVRYLGTLQDITERKETETALQEAETRHRLAIEAARMAVWEYDIATGEVKSSAALNRMYGLPDDAKPTIEDLRQCYAPGERDRVQKAGQEALERGERQFEVEFRCRRGDGSFYWLLLRAEIMFSRTGEMERVIGVLMDIDERKRYTERQNLMARELNHRVKNSLTVVQALATQSFRHHAVGDALKVFQGRLQALAQANNVLLENDWQVFDLLPLVEEITGPYRDEGGDDPFVIDGDDVALPPSVNVPVALALHELCTNAAKYGALSVPGGRVVIRWRPQAENVELTWAEIGGPKVASPGEQGFGMRLLTQVLSRELGGIDLSFSEEGLTCTMLLPVATS